VGNIGRRQIPVDLMYAACVLTYSNDNDIVMASSPYISFCYFVIHRGLSFIEANTLCWNRAQDLVYRARTSGYDPTSPGNWQALRDTGDASLFIIIHDLWSLVSIDLQCHNDAYCQQVACRAYITA
jgi:hypothetical protein